MAHIATVSVKAALCHGMLPGAGSGRFVVPAAPVVLMVHTVSVPPDG